MIWLKSIGVGWLCALPFCLLVGFVTFLLRPRPAVGIGFWNPVMFLQTARAWVLLAMGFLAGVAWEYHRATQSPPHNLR
jgi:hypothetical protein